MSKPSRALLAIACLALSIATALGAYGSHGLANVLDASHLRSFEIAVDYQFFHALGVMGLAIVVDRYRANRLFVVCAGLVLIGMLLFCGGLYASALGGPRLIARGAPAGGSLLILAWLVGAYGALRNRAAATEQTAD
jgi:uncharacterized membrane protein YgdD (TMEM256/DUF423 family)